MTIRIAAMMLAALFANLAAAGTGWAQSVSDPVPLLNGTEKAKVLYSIPYVYSDSNIAMCAACTSTEKSNAGTSDWVAVEVFEEGTVQNDLTAGEGVTALNSGGYTQAICTRDPLSVGPATLMGTEAEAVIRGAGRIVGTTNKLICTAFLVSVAGNPPTFMTILPLYKGTKQKGGM